jgi:hypothetical protein
MLKLFQQLLARKSRPPNVFTCLLRARKLCSPNSCSRIFRRRRILLTQASHRIFREHEEGQADTDYFQRQVRG